MLIVSSAFVPWPRLFPMNVKQNYNGMSYLRVILMLIVQQNVIHASLLFLALDVAYLLGLVSMHKRGQYFTNAHSRFRLLRFSIYQLLYVCKKHYFHV